MKVLLVDVDSKIPNLALMKISAYHKQRGDIVGFNTTNPDAVYASIIYEKNRYRSDEIINGLFKFQPLFFIGGTGYDNRIKLDDNIEKMKPDYDLYPSTYSQGFTTRGCIRNCSFCMVRQKEGCFRVVQHPKEFHDDRFDTIMIMDNNWLVNENWFETCAYFIIEHDLKVIENGFDIRLLTEKNVDIIRQFKKPKNSLFHFAFDSLDYQDDVYKGLILLKNAGFDLKREICFYVYMKDDSDFNSALSRVRLLRYVEVNAYLMYNINEPKTRRVKDLERWCNNRWCYWKTDFNEYIRTM